MNISQLLDISEHLTDNTQSVQKILGRPYYSTRHGYGSNDSRMSRLKAQMFLDNHWRHQRERPPLFSPLANLYDPEPPDYVASWYDRCQPSRYHQHEKILEGIRVAPMDSIYRPPEKTVDELRVRPRISYPGRILRGMHGQHRPVQPPVAKHRPPGYRQMKQEDLLPKTDILQPPKVKENFYLPETYRVHPEYTGGAYRENLQRNIPEEMYEKYQESTRQNFNMPEPMHRYQYESAQRRHDDYQHIRTRPDSLQPERLAPTHPVGHTVEMHTSRMSRPVLEERPNVPSFALWGTVHHLKLSDGGLRGTLPDIPPPAPVKLEQQNRVYSVTQGTHKLEQEMPIYLVPLWRQQTYVPIEYSEHSRREQESPLKPRIVLEKMRPVITNNYDPKSLRGQDQPVRSCPEQNHGLVQAGDLTRERPETMEISKSVGSIKPSIAQNGFRLEPQNPQSSTLREDLGVLSVAPKFLNPSIISLGSEAQPKTLRSQDQPVRPHPGQDHGLVHLGELTRERLENMTHPGPVKPSIINNGPSIGTQSPQPSTLREDELDPRSLNVQASPLYNVPKIRDENRKIGLTMEHSGWTSGCSFRPGTRSEMSSTQERVELEHTNPSHPGISGFRTQGNSSMEIRHNDLSETPVPTICRHIGHSSIPGDIPKATLRENLLTNNSHGPHGPHGPHGRAPKSNMMDALRTTLNETLEARASTIPYTSLNATYSSGQTYFMPDTLRETLITNVIGIPWQNLAPEERGRMRYVHLNEKRETVQRAHKPTVCNINLGPDPTNLRTSMRPNRNKHHQPKKQRIVMPGYFPTNDRPNH
jgi:hypothetical protein